MRPGLCRLSLKFVKILSSVNSNLLNWLIADELINQNMPNLTITLSRALSLFVCGGLSAIFTYRYFVIWRAALTK